MKRALDGMDQKRLRLWVSVGVGAAALLLIASTFFSGGGGSAPKAAVSAAPADQGGGPGHDLIAYQGELSQALQGALSAIAGAGTVHVSLTLGSGPSYLYAFNQTTRRQVSGSGSQATTDTTSQTQLAMTGNGQSPVLTQEVAPKVVGALIVASGARNPIVREELANAARSLLGLPAYAIEVLPGGGTP